MIHSFRGGDRFEVLPRMGTKLSGQSIMCMTHRIEWNELIRELKIYLEKFPKIAKSNFVEF